MMAFLKKEVLPNCAVGLVGGSDLSKIREQMGGDSFSNHFVVIFELNYVKAYVAPIRNSLSRSLILILQIVYVARCALSHNLVHTRLINIEFFTKRHFQVFRILIMYSRKMV